MRRRRRSMSFLIRPRRTRITTIGLTPTITLITILPTPPIARLTTDTTAVTTIAIRMCRSVSVMEVITEVTENMAVTRITVTATVINTDTMLIGEATAEDIAAEVDTMAAPGATVAARTPFVQVVTGPAVAVPVVQAAAVELAQCR